MPSEAKQPRITSRTKLLDAALTVFRQKGYAATTVDELCAAAGVTKGAFFHHFDGKEALGVAATQHFADMADGLFANAPYHQWPDPRDRLLGYVDLRIAMLEGRLCDVTCLLGTFVQELYDSHPAIRGACERHLFAHIDMIAADAAEARNRYAPDADWSAESLAVHIQSALQGAFIFAKAKGDTAVAVESLKHLRRYIELLLVAA
jgi:TetR/AcrR family transcriptional repressor of nem operon